MMIAKYGSKALWKRMPSASGKAERHDDCQRQPAGCRNVRRDPEPRTLDERPVGPTPGQPTLFAGLEQREFRKDGRPDT